MSKAPTNSSSWSTSASTVAATEGNIATLRDESHLKANDINTSGKSILGTTMDGGTF